MHILLGLISILATVAIVLIRLRLAADATRELVGVAGDARSMVRRWRWRQKLARDPMDLVRDPREAAVVMMVATAQTRGALTERQRDVILDHCRSTLGVSKSEAEALLAHGRWLTSDVHDLDRCFDRLKPLLRERLDTQQRAELVAMLADVAAAEGPSGGTAAEGNAIARLARGL